MESSIAEFLMRQLASEQLPTSYCASCGVCARTIAATTSTALRRAARTHTRSTLLQARWVDGTYVSAGSAASAALANTFAKYTFSAFWL